MIPVANLEQTPIGLLVTVSPSGGSPQQEDSMQLAIDSRTCAPQNPRSAGSGEGFRPQVHSKYK